MSEQKRSGYMQEVDAWLTAVLITREAEDETDEQWLTRVKTQLKQKLLESYRNGQAAGPRREFKRPLGAPRAR